MTQRHLSWQVQYLMKLEVSHFVAGADKGDVAVSVFVVGAAPGDLGVSLFVAGAASGGNLDR